MVIDNKPISTSRLFICLFLLWVFPVANAADYHVGPSQPLHNIGDVPWASLQAGDRVFIHWRAAPYREKWVINARGTATNPILVAGVPNVAGDLPVVSGENALTAPGLDFWNEARGLIKIGGSNVPDDGLPQHIIIENLDLRSARPPYQFTDDSGQIQTYSHNAAAIYVEKAANLTIRNCRLHDSGNGLFVGAFNGQTQDILIEKNRIEGNGNVGRIYEHNSYTAGIHVTFQFNYFGPLRAGAQGNNLKDRSAGLVVRYNWIESGNRQLDLVDAEDSQAVVNHPDYHVTHVYGNILIEPDESGNSQMVHYGGDSGTIADYRKGTLSFYHNTLISTRSGNTTVLRLSTAEESAEVFNNIIYPVASGFRMAIFDGQGTVDLYSNWLKTGWVNCHCSPTGTVLAQANLEGLDPGFEDFSQADFRPAQGSLLQDAAVPVPASLLPEHAVSWQYRRHQQGVFRADADGLDIGALEQLVDLIFISGFQ